MPEKTISFEALQQRMLQYPDNAKLLAGLPLLQLKGKPLSLDDFFFFKFMYRMDLPRQCCCKCGRQVGKSQNLANSEVLKASGMPFMNTLFVCPRFEQIKRFSANYVRPLIHNSPIRHLMVDESSATTQNITQRSFRSGSTHFYSFAFLDAERIRGLSVGSNVLDEVQDIMWDHVPVIAQTLAGSPKWKQRVYTGTPKTMDNTIQKLWADSSMAEWATKCEACNYWNISCVEQDALKMIGTDTVVCAKCSRPINPRNGGWVHTFPERTTTFVGYHVPQIIHPYHYEDRENWQDFLLNYKKYPLAKFMNECMGESYDSSEKLITLTDLRRISLLQPTNTVSNALMQRRKYRFIAVGIDWGGGGPESQSYTAVSIAGLLPGDDNVHILCSFKMNRNLMPHQEVKEIMELCAKIRPDIVAHDYTGAGHLREVMMLQCGMPAARLAPFTYSVTTNTAIISLSNASKNAAPGQRASYTMDKPRSLITLCAMMRAGKVLLPKWAAEKEENVFIDFLNLIQVVQERPRGSDVYLIDKTAGTSDDICHSINYACSAIWYSHQRYPDIAEAMSIRLTREDIDNITPREPSW